MPSHAYETSDVAANMAKRLQEHTAYARVLSGINVDRVSFIHISGKKKPKSLPSPIQIKAIPPLFRALTDNQVFVVSLFDEWFDWSESKQYASLLEQLMMIKDDGRTTFEDGKLRKYDVVALRYMVENFGLDWTDKEDVKHPIEDFVAEETETRGTMTFSGSTGVARNTEVGVQVMVGEADVEHSLDNLPDED